MKLVENVTILPVVTSLDLNVDRVLQAAIDAPSPQTPFPYKSITCDKSTLQLVQLCSYGLQSELHNMYNSDYTLGMKNLTFAIGLSWLLYGAVFFDYPDWDIPVSILMACSTYLCADWVWQNLRTPKHWPLAALLTWWCVDGSYSVYWSLVDPSVMIREGQWPMSLCLFLLCGAIWTAAPTLARFRDNLRPVVQGWKAWHLHPQSPFSERVRAVRAVLQGSTAATR